MNKSKRRKMRMTALVLDIRVNSKTSNKKVKKTTMQMKTMRLSATPLYLSS